MDYVYFFREEKENIPVIIGNSRGYTCLNPNPKTLERITKYYPKSKGNLFALVDGHVFKIDSSVCQSDLSNSEGVGMKVIIKKSNSKSGSNREAETIQEAKKIVNQLIDEETVEITIIQKEWNRSETTRAF